MNNLTTETFQSQIAKGVHLVNFWDLGVVLPYAKPNFR